MLPRSGRRRRRGRRSLSRAVPHASVTSAISSGAPSLRPSRAPRRRLPRPPRRGRRCPAGREVGQRVGVLMAVADRGQHLDGAFGVRQALPGLRHRPVHQGQGRQRRGERPGLAAVLAEPDRVPARLQGFGYAARVVRAAACSCHSAASSAGSSRSPCRSACPAARPPARAPRRLARARAAAGAWAITAASSPAATAWWTRRVRSGSGSASSTASIRALHCIRTAAGSGDSTARRDSSWRNPTPCARSSTSPVRSARCEHPEVAEQLPGQPELHARRQHGELLEGRLLVGGEALQAGEHGVHHRRGHPVTGARGGHHLGDEERVARGEPVERSRRERRAARQPRDRRAGEPGRREPAHRGASQRAEHPLQRGTDLFVPIGRHHQRGRSSTRRPR